MDKQIVDLDITKVEQSDLETEVENQLDGAKADIAQQVIEAFGGVPVFGTVDDNNTITLTTMLADGDYTLVYANDDGTIEEIGTITVGGGIAYVNLFNPDSATLNQRWSNSSYNFVTSSGNGYVVSDFIPVTISTDTNNPTILRFRDGTWAGQAGVIYYDSSKSVKASTTASTNGTGQTVVTEIVKTDVNGDSYIHLGYKNDELDSGWTSGVAYIRLCLQINSTSTAITTSDIQDIIITIDEPIVD